MYRGLPPRCIFFCPFLEKTREKIHFWRDFRALNLQPFNALSNSELLILCTWFIGCMRCDRLASVIFRASGSKFRVTVRTNVRENPHETASRHRRRESREARGLRCLLLRVDCGISTFPLQPPESPRTDAFTASAFCRSLSP